MKSAMANSAKGRVAWLLLGWSVACSPQDSAPSSSNEDEADMPPVAELQMPEGPTTSAAIVLANLDSAVNAAEVAYARRTRVEEASELVRQRLARFRITNNLEDLDRATEVADALPRTAAAAQVRAQVFSTRHLFAEAADELDAAESMGAPAPDLARARAAIDLARGRPQDALDRLEATGDRFDAAFLRASALADLGRFMEAEAAYVRALESYPDVSPIPVAELQFRRGVMWSEKAGFPNLGQQAYLSGLQALSAHVTMTVHAAEVWAETGQLDRAIDALRALDPASDEPELAAALGELLVTRGDRDQGLRYLALARQRYETRLSRHREAYLDHGSEFFRGPGEDPRRAVALATENLALRPTERAYLLALEAAVAFGDDNLACRWIGELDPEVLTIRDLRELVQELEPGC